MKRKKTAGGIVLDEEIQYFNESLEDWLKQYQGMVALVKGKELIGVFNTEDEALAEGARRYQLQPFLVRRIMREQPNISIPALTLGILNAYPTHTN
jgi:hypothetical protein